MRDSHVGRNTSIALTAGLLLTSACASSAARAPVRTAELDPVRTKPRLVLQITVDQLRGDMPAMAMPHLPPGGLRYLYEQGVTYENARHGHANTETIVGHATLATGADPSTHGMIGNVWFDRATGASRYNIEDAEYHLIGEGGEVDAKTEIDPTQRAARSDGRSPNAILTSTFSDELARAGRGKAKVFGVSVKDRGAVSMAGHSGKAFWFSKKKGEFVTSSYYYDAYPKWVTDWNAQKLAQAYGGKAWELRDARETYEQRDADDKPYERDIKGFGRTFPHAYGPADSPYFTTFLTLSPAGDDLTLSFAKALIEAEDIGADDVTDYLSVSLSSTDYVGHVFGPSSLESEDNLRRLDHTIARLLALVDVRVGLDNTLVVLSADHGAPEVPGRLEELGQDAGYVDADFLESEELARELRARFKIGPEVVKSYVHPYLYLDHELIAASALDQSAVEACIAEVLEKQDGIEALVSTAALRAGKARPSAALAAVKRNDHRERSGDLYLVTKANWFINDFDGLEVASSHGSPWQYDQWVPIVFAGHGIVAQCVKRDVETVDIAATLSAYLGITRPSGTNGKPLGEVLDTK